jgi:hypothetical protein
MWTILVLLSSLTFHHHFIPTITTTMSLDLTEASTNPSDPSQASAAGDESFVPTTVPAPKTLYVYIRGPIHANYMPDPAAQIEFLALPGTIESLAGMNEQDTISKMSVMRNRVENSVERDLSQWSKDFFRPPQSSAQTPCQTKFYMAWENDKLDALKGMAEEENAKGGIQFEVMETPEDLAKVQRGITEQSSYFSNNKPAQSTQASIDR